VRIGTAKVIKGDSFSKTGFGILHNFESVVVGIASEIDFITLVSKTLLEWYNYLKSINRCRE